MYGVRLQGPADIAPLADTPIEKVPNVRRLVQKKAKLALSFAADRAKERYNAQHRPMEYQEGNLVYINLHRDYALPGRPPRKISQQRTGPYKVKKRVGQLAYEINLPNHWGIHPVINMQQLTPAPRPNRDPFGHHVPPPDPIIPEANI